MATKKATQHQAVNHPRRRFIRTTAGGVLLAATGTAAISACSTTDNPGDSATSAWRTIQNEKDTVRWALSHAILAPNPHNLQPWLVDLSSPNEFLLTIDPNRLLPETDPFGRQIMIGTGAFLGLFELAAASRGYRTTLEWIAARPADSEATLTSGQPILRVRISRENPALTAAAQSLFQHIPNRHTVRNEYDFNRAPDEQVAQAFNEFKTAQQRVSLVTQTTQENALAEISQRVKDAWFIELSTEATVMESMRLLRIGRAEINKYRDGISIDSTWLSVLDKLGLFNRDEAPQPGSQNFNRQINDFNAAVDSTPAWYCLCSDTNTRMDQLEAGKSFVQAQLKATELGLVMHPVSQGLQEYAEMASVYRDMHAQINRLQGTDAQTLQMLSRVGYLPAGSTSVGPAPRRGLAAHIRA